MALRPLNAIPLFLSVGLGCWSCAHSQIPLKNAAEIRRQPIGPVRLAVIAAVVAPAKIRPAPPSSKPLEEAGTAIGVIGKALRVGKAFTGIGALLGLASLLVESGDSGPKDDTPDPRLEVFVNEEGKAWVNASVVRSNYVPTWNRVISREPRRITANSNIVIAAWDGEGESAKLGNCTITGIPVVDGNNYVVEDSMVCHGRLLAAQVQLRPVDPNEERIRETYRLMSFIQQSHIAWQVSSGKHGCPRKLADLMDKNKEPKDPWNNAFVLTCPGEHGEQISVTSRGPDGKQKTDDDLHSWDPRG